MLRHKRFLVALGLLLSAACGPMVNAGKVEERFVGDRRFVVVDPASVSGAAPLVLALHGAFGSADSFREQADLGASAEAMGFRVVYLEGLGRGRNQDKVRTWNAGRCCGSAERNGVDDLGYINAVIASFQSQGLVSGVHMVGHSNGGMMIHRYLCEGGAPVASAVIVSGSKMNDGCRNRVRTRTLLLHGDRDENVPVAGGEGNGRAGVAFTSLDASASALRTAGADVTVQILPGAAHSVRTLDNAVRRSERVSLAQYAAQFLMGR